MGNQSHSVQLPPQWIDQQDARFFERWPQRRAHIRKPLGAECEAEFRSLGDHIRDRRRIILWRIPEDNPFYSQLKQPIPGKKLLPILKLPFLAFIDETIEDEDAVLLPIIEEIMQDASTKYAGQSSHQKH